MRILAKDNKTGFVVVDGIKIRVWDCREDDEKQSVYVLRNYHYWNADNTYCAVPAVFGSIEKAKEFISKYKDIYINDHETTAAQLKGEDPKTIALILSGCPEKESLELDMRDVE